MVDEGEGAGEHEEEEAPEDEADGVGGVEHVEAVRVDLEGRASLLEGDVVVLEVDALEAEVAEDADEGEEHEDDEVGDEEVAVVVLLVGVVLEDGDGGGVEEVADAEDSGERGEAVAEHLDLPNVGAEVGVGDFFELEVGVGEGVDAEADNGGNEERHKVRAVGNDLDEGGEVLFGRDKQHDRALDHCSPGRRKLVEHRVLVRRQQRLVLPLAPPDERCDYRVQQLSLDHEVHDRRAYEDYYRCNQACRPTLASQVLEQSLLKVRIML